MKFETSPLPNIAAVIVAIGTILGIVTLCVIGIEYQNQCFAAPINQSSPPANVVRVFAEEKDGSSNGTGTLIRSDLVITNHHVVRDCTGTVRVLFPDWTVYEAEIVKVDKLWDLAALRIHPVLTPPRSLGETPHVGDAVTVGGYGSGWYAASEGRVLKFHAPDRRSPGDLFNIDANVRSGDSGGPVLAGGRLVGVIFGCSDGTYAITVGRVRWFLEGVK